VNLAAARPDGIVLSTNDGVEWMPMQVPSSITRIHCIAFSADGTFWLGGREGVFFTRDLGKSWMWIERLPFRDVDDLSFDAGMNKVLVSSRASDQIFAIDPKDLSWKFWQTGYQIDVVRSAGKRMVAASLYDGVVVQPQAGGHESAGSKLAGSRGVLANLIP
jgi:photosystem II stability/assembly factor-like uncharacterized protein